MANLPIRPITTKQRIMGAVALFKKHGTSKWVKIGAFENINITPNITRVPSYTPEFGDRRLIGNFTTEKSGEVSIEGMSQWTEFAYETMFMSEKNYFVQSAATDLTFSFEDIEVGGVYQLDGKKATNVEFDGAATWVEDTHFTVYPLTNTVEIIALPSGVVAGADVTGTYDIEAITVADKMLDLTIMESSGNRGELRVIGVIRGGPGTEIEVHLNDVEFIPSGAVSIGDTANLNVGAITATMYSTGVNGYGVMRSLQAV